MTDELKSLERRLDDCMIRDRQQLRKRLGGLRRKPKAAAPDSPAFRAVKRAVEASAGEAAARRDGIPRFRYPGELPVSERAGDIAEAIRRHRVIVVAGDTGSGKTTQIPKICLEAGRGVHGMIGHTQPRRVAARSTASRIAEELESPVGKHVGYKVRFDDRVDSGAYVKLLTDGMLLAETQGDRHLERYDTLIIDEAHERSLNIDFLLGYVRRLLDKRRDLKVVITSATLDTERFSKHFGDAPIIEVEGRTYPVEVRYRPLEGEDEGERDQSQKEGVVAAVEELCAEGSGDILVFHAGEREIRDTAEALRKRQLPDTEILPLYARLSAKEQDRVFRPSGRQRRIVLATNVAETSLTVPGIRYVVDPGTARISRYSYKSKVQRLPIEPVSRASADQRAGRCGRVAPGICIRLYSREDYEARPEFTEPEIQRTNLASVILQMKLLKLGEIERFPFVDAPSQGLIRDGYRLLEELHAMEGDRRLTETGELLARLPVDPRLGRIVEAGRRFNCLREALVLAAGLSVQDPRERPAEKRQAADEAHQQFLDEQSDFGSLVNLWNAYREAAAELSGSQLRRWCRERFLGFMRLREWQDIHRQLLSATRDERGWRLNQKAPEYHELHKALLAGFPTQVGRKGEGHAYETVRQGQFHIFPGSGLFKQAPKWVMAAELVQTTRTFARTVAGIRPEWVEEVAAHLVKRRCFEPHFQPRPGRVAGFESVTLYGLTLCEKRRINYASREPAEARQVFIREALVNDRLDTRAGFARHNRELIASVREMEAKSRRRDILVDEEGIHAFFDARLPEDVVDAGSLHRWLKREGEAADRRLRLSESDLMSRDPSEVTGEAFPDRLVLRGVPFALAYHFDPGGERDGVTMDVPVARIRQIEPAEVDWIVPGFLEEKVTALIRSLPKARRKHFVPAPDFGRACVERMEPRTAPLTEAVARELHRMTGVPVAPDEFRLEQLPAHLYMTVRVLAANGRVLKEDTDLGALQSEFGHLASREVESVETADWPSKTTREWDFGRIPDVLHVSRDGMEFTVYPAVKDQGDAVESVVCDSASDAERITRQGILRLFRLALRQQEKYLRKTLARRQKMALKYRRFGSGEDLADAIVTTAFAETFLQQDLPRDLETFEQRLDANRSRLVANADELASLVEDILDRAHEINKRLGGRVAPSLLETMQDIRGQLDALLSPDFVATTPPGWLQRYPVYLRAIEVRLNKLELGNPRDPERMKAAQAWWRRFRELEQRAGDHRPEPLEWLRWMIEEYRVQLFAQELGTALTVSDKRLEEQAASARKTLRKAA